MSEAQAKVATKSDWFILRGEMKYGPYEYKALIAMIQSGELFDYNYVWAPHIENWTMVGDLQDFSKDRLCRLIDSKDPAADSFKLRQSPRAEIVTAVYAHNNQMFFDGHTISISENGALLLLNDPLLLPNQKVLIHFQESDINPHSFNVVGEIIRKNYSKQRLNVKSGLHYAVRFLQVQEHGLEQLKKWSRGERATKGENNGIL